MNTAHAKLTQAPFHALRIVASFALLGAVVAGSATVIPSIAAAATTSDLNAIGALAGFVAGAVGQVMRG